MDFLFERPPFAVSTDPSRLDLDAMYETLRQSYWCEEIPRDLLARAIENSLCFGLYDGQRQIGLARVITDRATYAYLCDVYVLEEYRGKGLGTWLMECVVAHPDLQGLRRFSLVTRDAHELYRKSGFTPLAAPERHMEIARPGIYKKATQA